MENGVTLITHLSTPREKNVNFCLAVGVGHNHETKENLGISALFEKLLLSRTKGIIADYAGTMTYYYLEVPVEKVPDAIAALAGMVTKTSFSDKEIEAEREAARRGEDCRFQRKSGQIPFRRPGRSRSGELFPPIPRRQLKLLYKHTAYGVADINWDMEGYINSVSRFTNEDLQAFAKQFYVTHNMALLVGGNINADEIAARAEKAFVDLPKGKKNKVQKDIYTGGFATIPAQQQSLFYFGFDISGIRNAELAVLIKLLNGRLERSFIGSDVLSDVRIAGYYGRRTLQISIKTQQKNIGEILDTVCRNIIRIKTEKASPRRMERSRNLAMTGYMEMFGSEIARSREVSWQIFSQGEMFDIQELMFAIPEVSARNIREAAEKIFSTPMTLVCSSDQPVDYQALCAQIRQ